MRRICLLLQFVPLLILALSVSASAQGVTPSLLNYQGLLADSSGEPITAQGLVVTFKIWDHPISTDPVSLRWEETLTIDVTDGLFNVILGETVPITEDVFSTSESYLGITIPDEPESTPRTRLVSVGYSTRVETVDGARGGVISGSIGLETGEAKTGSEEVLRYELYDANSILRYYASATEVYTPCVLFSSDSTIQCTAAFNSGAAQAQDGVSSVSVASSLTTILSESINCPMDGYVMVFGSFEAEVNHSGGANSTLLAGVSELADALPPDQNKRWTVPGNSANSLNRNTISAGKIFAVTAGEETFHMLAMRTEGADDFLISQMTLSLVFIPRAYGVVSGAEFVPDMANTAAASAKPGNSPGVMIARKSATRTETRTELERQAAEIASLKEQVAELKQLLQSDKPASR